jgi:hypothetical protein
MTIRKIALVTAALALAAAGCGLPAAHAGAGRAAADCATTTARSDVNGDGFDDIVAGDPFADVRGVLGAGAVYVLLGSEEGPGRGDMMVLSAPDGRDGDGFGWSVRTAHLDEDRCLDIVVGAPYADSGGVTDSGAAYVFTGTAEGTPTGERVEAPGRRREKAAHFGWSLAAVDGRDGEPSIVAIGAPHEDAEGVKDSGAVYLRYRGSDGEVTLDRLTQGSEGVIGNSEPGDQFGWSLVFGRLGGDAARTDLVVGTPYEDVDGVGQQREAQGIPDVGGVTIVHDVVNARGRYTSVKHELGDSRKVMGNAGERFGHAVDYAEWQGEGYLAVSAPGVDVGGVSDAGQIRLYKRDANGTFARIGDLRPGTGVLRSARAAEGARLGWSLAFWNPRDSLVLAIGSPFESARGNPTPESGLVRQVTVAGGEGADQVAERTGAEPNERFGWAVADLGGGDDVTPGNRLVVGIPDERSSNGGAVAVVAGADIELITPVGGDEAVAADFGSSIS